MSTARSISLYAFLLLLAGAAGPVCRASTGECAATPEAAVLHGLGAAGVATGTEGYRVRDVIVDPLLQRSFVRVERCGDPLHLAMLLPFAAAERTAPAAPVLTAAALPAINPLRAGSSVEIAMQSRHVNLLLRGKTMAAAEVGSPVEVEVAAVDGNEPGHRFRGRLVSTRRVEVEP